MIKGLFLFVFGIVVGWYFFGDHKTTDKTPATPRLRKDKQGNLWIKTGDVEFSDGHNGSTWKSVTPEEDYES